MFFCQLTKQTSKPGEARYSVPVVKRERVYTRWVQDEKTDEWKEVEIARGTEIVKEITVCEEGMCAWTEMLESGKVKWEEKIVEALDGKEKHLIAKW